MAETLATWFVEHLSGSVSREMIVFIVSLLPILELVSDEATKEKMREEMESKVGLYGHGKNS